MWRKLSTDHVCNDCKDNAMFGQTQLNNSMVPLLEPYRVNIRKKKKIPAELSFFSVFSDMEKNKELRKIILANLFFSNSSQVTNTGEKTI